MNNPAPVRRVLPVSERSRRVTAILGPTNTGKTHFAIERMLGHSSGLIGLPLRLLAREVYQRLVDRAGVEAVALITGEEKIKPRQPRYWVSTMEAMPRDLDVAFVALDEIQLAADLDRGHVFTDRLLNRRGFEETLIIGAMTMRPALEQLLPGINIQSRPRLSQLLFAGEKKLSRLPRRSAIVAFSTEEVYAIAELVRRQRGGAAVVLGSLSPRTRNAQVEIFQNGDVDYIIATDAIGMGLNLDIDHLAFAGDQKFDGWQYRRLLPAEIGQIAGRAGRYMRDGTFGTTGRCAPFDEDLVAAVEDHAFDPVGMLQWRNADLDFSTIAALQASLDRMPKEPRLTRAPLAEDVLVLDIAAHDADVQRQARTRADVERLWDACQVPDYRKLSPAAHSELVLTIYGFIVRGGRVPDDWMKRHLATFDRTDGDIDTLSARIAQVRTFNYIANRPDWLRDPEHWQGITRQVEDNLSDALHARLAHRFIDRRTSVLMRRLRENAMLEAEITNAGDVLVEGQHIGSLHGFRFTPDPQASGEAARALNAAAQKALASEIEGRATRVHEAVDTAFVLANDGTIRWLGEAVGKIAAGDHLLSPQVRVLADEQLSGPALERVQERLSVWLAQHVKKLLGQLTDLEAGTGLEGLARGIAFQVAESLGVLERSRVANDMKTLPQDGRAALRKLGVRFGAYHIFLPLLLKPAPRALAAQLWALRNGGLETVKGFDEIVHLAASGRTSFPATAEAAKGLYLAAGFRLCGERAVRVDILERLADLIRPAIAYRPGVTPGDPPPGSADGDGFVVTVGMTSLAGCSGEAFASILQSLGYAMEKRKGPAITVPLLPAMPTAPVVVEATADATDAAAPESPDVQAEENAEAPAVAAEAAEQTDVAAESSDAAPVEPAVVETEVAPAETRVAAVEAESPPAVADGATLEGAPETPAADVEATGDESAPAVEAVAVEIADIEVWHPQRRQQPQRRPDRNRNPRREGHQRHQPAEARPAAEGDAVAATAPREGAPPERQDQRRRDNFRRNDGPRNDRPRNNNRPAPAQAPAVEGEQAVPATQEQQRPRNDFRRGGGGQQGRPERSGERRPDQRRDSGGGRPQGGDRNRNDRTFASTERPQRERQPDPNSPFAKLLALKEQLEGKGKKD